MAERIFIDFGWSLLPPPVKFSIGLYYALHNVQRVQQVYETFCYLTSKAREVTKSRPATPASTEWVWVAAQQQDPTTTE